MGRITEFESPFASLLPEIHRILTSANFWIHPNVALVTLHGSRGPAGGYRGDSDIDLCLIIDIQQGTQSDAQTVPPRLRFPLSAKPHRR